MVKYAKDAGTARTRRTDVAGDKSASPDDFKKTNAWNLVNGTLEFGAPPINYEILRGDGISSGDLPKSQNIQLYFSMGGSGGTVEDHSGNGLDGTIDGNANRASDIYDSEFDGISFDGSGGVSGFGGLGSPPSAYTVSTLIIPSAPPSDRDFFWDLGADWSVVFKDDVDKMGLLQVSNGSTDTVEIARPPQGVPTLVTSRWNGSRTIVDLDDNVRVATQSTGALDSRNADSRLGRIGSWSGSSPSYWTGDMLLFIVWDNALSDSEVVDLAEKLGVGQKYWSPSHESSNPIVAGTSLDTGQSYPPSAVRGPNGTYYMTVKSNSTIYVFSSGDGVSWTEETSILGSDPHEQTVLRYDPSAGDWKLYVDERNNDNLQFWTASSPTGTWSEHPDSPLFQTHTIGGTTYEDHKVCDHIVVDGTHYVYFYTGSVGAGDPFSLQVASGASWTDLSVDKVLLKDEDMPEANPVLQGPTVFRNSSGEYVFVFTAGRGSSGGAERALYAAWGESPTEFNPTRSDVAHSGVDPGWRNERVYNAQWLKKQDGEYLSPLKPDGDYWLYYSGHAISANSGYTGLARYSELPRLRDMKGI